MGLPTRAASGGCPAACGSVEAAHAPPHRVKLADALVVLGWGLLSVAGVLFALLELGVLLIADCGPECVARGERLLVIALIALGVVVAVGGAWMARRKLKRVA